MEERLWTTNELAEMLHLNPATIQRWIRANRLPAINLGGSAGYRFRHADVQHLLYRRYGQIHSLAERAAVALQELADALEDFAQIEQTKPEPKPAVWAAHLRQPHEVPSEAAAWAAHLRATELEIRTQAEPYGQESFYRPFS